MRWMVDLWEQDAKSEREFIGNLPVRFRADEQRAIADFLDYETARLDDLIGSL